MAQGDPVPGKVLKAGLPNISGTFPIETVRNVGVSGAFYDHSGYYNYEGAKGVDYTCALAGFDASRSSPVYGRSETVQPPALTVRYLIRARS